MSYVILYLQFNLHSTTVHTIFMTNPQSEITRIEIRQFFRKSYRTLMANNSIISEMFLAQFYAYLCDVYREVPFCMEMILSRYAHNLNDLAAEKTLTPNFYSLLRNGIRRAHLSRKQWPYQTRLSSIRTISCHCIGTDRVEYGFSFAHIRNFVCL